MSDTTDFVWPGFVGHLKISYPLARDLLSPCALTT